MVMLTGILKSIGMADNGPANLPEIALQQVVVDLPQEKSVYCYVGLPDRPASVELTDRLLALGTVVFVTEVELPSTRHVTWLDFRRPGVNRADSKVQLPVGLLVADARAAFVHIAQLLRSQTAAQVVTIVGAEGLRTSQRVMQSVLSQRFQTDGPDRLLCDPDSTAQGLLSLGQHTERLLLRLDLADLDNARFVADSVRPDVVVLVNTRADEAGSATAAAAEGLIRSLSDDRLAIINADDPGVQAMMARLDGRAFCYGLQPKCNLWASQIESQGREGLRLRMHFNRDTVHVRIPLLGRNSVHTVLAATAVGLQARQSWDEIVAGLRTMSAQLHLIVTPGVHGSSLVEDSYDATPSSTLSILNLLEDFPGRKVAVLGDMVEFAPLELEGHRKVGRRVVDVASVLVTVGRNGEIIAQEALACGMATDRVHCSGDNEQATAALREVLEPGDIVLVTGAGRLNMRQIVDRLSDTQTSLCEV
jgi:UDP-N-acetylmuramoyl-tripeptide--D-alanyl-D-alanine ligase